MLRQSDLDAYAEMCGDPEVMRHVGNGQPLNRADAWRNLAMMLGHWQLRGYGQWAVEEKASGALVGRVGFWEPEGWPAFEVGWMLHRSHWGRGFATEAARAALEHAFQQMGRTHVISLIRVGNLASVRVAERVGERLEGRMELTGFDTWVYGIGREDWARLGK
jgi:RimJ/RimL family protein N-acetyltransferase